MNTIFALNNLYIYIYIYEYNFALLNRYGLMCRSRTQPTN